jgi:hypothetical protein
MIVEKQMECRLAGETEVLGENLPQRHFVHHKIPYDQTRDSTRVAAVGSRLVNHFLLLFIPFLAPTGAWGIHENFRFTSVSQSTTVGRTLWTSGRNIHELGHENYKEES